MMLFYLILKLFTKFINNVFSDLKNRKFTLNNLKQTIYENNTFFLFDFRFLIYWKQF